MTTMDSFEDFYLDLYLYGVLIFTGYAGDFDAHIYARCSKSVKLLFTGDDYAVLLDNGVYDVRDILEADIAFTCWYH